MPDEGIPQPVGINSLIVRDFKALHGEHTIQIRPLTILAGANSSGKSSIMQPLLLMKQTFESRFDPGALLLNGPNVKFTSTKQFMISDSTEFGVGLTNSDAVRSTFTKSSSPALEISETNFAFEIEEGIVVSTLYPSMTEQELNEQLGWDLPDINKYVPEDYQPRISIYQGRSFLNVIRYLSPKHRGDPMVSLQLQTDYYNRLERIERKIQEAIHVPALRGNPKREYPLASAEGPDFEGRFEDYTSSVIFNWQISRKKSHNHLNQQLRSLGLTSLIAAEPRNDVEIEVRVGRMLTSKPDDMVSVADVGFGVSQVLPVLVALLVAEPGQLVYIEQPELHLHPRAQVALAKVLADAANRGVRVVVETHSVLLIQGIQTLIAQEQLAHETVILHWFTRDDDGKTTIESQEPDRYGAYGNWPEDFAEVQMQADSDYLDAVEQRELEGFNGRQEPETSGD